MASVFISSTNLDLEDYRLAALRAANVAELHAEMQEDWTAEDHPPLDACLERVRKADALVVILAHRYGWVPEDDARNPDGKSITWLECEEAVDKGKHVLAFVVDEGADWPEHLKDEADLKQAAAMTDAAEAMKLFQATHTSIQRLKDFKQWLGSRGLRRAFRTKQEFKLEVERALKAWRSRQVDEATGPKAREPAPTFIPSA
jgi:predicted NAD/FAD-dependent oxidoreductase